jgi:hypothetical protein
MTDLFIPAESRPTVLQDLIRQAWQVGALLEALREENRNVQVSEIPPINLADSDAPDSCESGR